MRVTQVLNAQHIGRAIKRAWFCQGKLKFRPSYAEKVLTDNNFKVHKIHELDPPPVQMLRDDFLTPEPVLMDENHPDWKEKPCYILRDNNVLLEGMHQARKLVNTDQIIGLPTAFIDFERNLEVSDEFHEEVKKRIMMSCIYDAHQQKLPKRRDPARPAWNFPRDYGITDARKISLLFYNLIHLCEMETTASDKFVLTDVQFVTNLEAHNKMLQFMLTGDFVISSTKKLSLSRQLPEGTCVEPPPDTYPVDCTVSIEPSHFYKTADSFYLGESAAYVHTLFISFDRTQVANLYGEEVTESQMIARNLMKAFAATAGQAKAHFGVNITQLSQMIEPFVVQVIMCDGKHFHFSVFELNSLDIDNENSERNRYWNTTPIPLYDRCEYFCGRPVLQGYNPDVVKRILAFYKNE